jgi:hypothetical protein
MNYSSLRPVSVVALALILLSPSALSAAAIPDSLFPLPEKVREIMNQRCVMCHGEEYDGKKEIREDLNLSTDEAIKETLSEAGRLKEVIVKNQMPQKAKLSFRLRKDAKHKERLETIKADYDKNGEREVLLAWLKDIVATETPEKKKKE